MEKIKSWQAWAFVLSLFIVALVINFGTDYVRELFAARISTASAPQLNPTNELNQAEDLRKLKKSIASARAAEEAVEKHTNDLARYVNPGSARKSSTPTIAIAVVSESGAFDSATGDALTARLNPQKLTIASGLFTPEFVSDGLFTSTFSGSRTVYSTLELSNAVDMLLLGRETINYSTNASLQGIVTASLRLELMTAPAAWKDQSRGWSYAANGSGFSPADARAQAQERISNQIASDTNNFSDHWYSRP